MVEIRLAKAEDIRDVIDVQVRTWRTTYDGIIPEEILQEKETAESKERSIERWKKMLTQRTTNLKNVCVVEEQGNIIGFSFYGKCMEEERYGIVNAGEIYAIYVLKEHQGKGIGNKLMNFALKDMRKHEYNKLVIWAIRENPSIGFYKRLGGDGRLTKEVMMGKYPIQETGFVYDMSRICKIVG